jgi:hypothetical protein
MFIHRHRQIVGNSLERTIAPDSDLRIEARAHPATQEPAMQDQSTPAPAAKHMKAKTTAHKKMAKGKHVKAKPAAPADDQAAPQ